MNTVEKYFDYTGQQPFPYVQNDNGSLPGLEWEQEGDTFRLIVIEFDARQMRFNNCNYKYEVYVKTASLPDYILVNEQVGHEVVSNDNYIDTVTGNLVDKSQFLVNDVYMPAETHVQQYTYFVNTIGKQVLYPKFLDRVANKKGLTIVEQ